MKYTNTVIKQTSDVLQRDGDGRTAGHIRQHAGRVTLPAGGSVSLCGREQP